MPDTPAVSGAPHSLGNYRQGSNKQPEREFYSNKKHKIALHIGEIIRGTILEIPSKSEAIVRLPIGTISASLQGNLIKGDSIYFKVVEIKPDLVLRIHAAPTKFGNRLVSNEELIRMLDLPSGKHIYEIVEFLRNYNSDIFRDEAYHLYINYLKITEKQIKQLPINNVFLLLMFLQDARITVNEFLFNKLVPVYQDKNKLSKLLDLLFIESEKLLNYNILQNKNIYDKLQAAKENINIAMSLFLTINGLNEKEPNFYNLLLNLVDFPKSKFIFLSSPILDIADKLIDIIKSLQLKNTFALASNLNTQVIIPIYINNSFKIIDLEIDSTKDIKIKKPIKFTISYNSEKFEEIISRGQLFQKHLELMILSQKDDYIAEISKSKQVLIESLQKYNYSIQDITIKNKDEIEWQLNDYFRKQSSEKISFVV